REDQPRYGEVHELVDTEGKCNLLNRSREWDPNSFGNAKDLKGVQLLVQEAAKNGLGSNVLFCPAKDVTECLAELIGTQPLFEKTLEGIATAEEWGKIMDKMPVWKKNLQNCNAGANYILFYSNTSVTVEVLLNELSKETYNCVGMKYIRQSLKKRVNAGGAADIVVAVNSGETTKGERPGDHIDNKRSGNPLPRLLALAFNKLESGSVTMENSVRTGWTSEKCTLDSVEAAKKRLLVEALFNILLGTQQAPSDEWRKDHERVEGVFVLGTNVISGGASERDPLRAASQMQSGEQGEMTLSELRTKPHLVVAVEYLIDRLGTLNVLTQVTREDALKMTAKQAYSTYCGENGKMDWSQAKSEEHGGLTKWEYSGATGGAIDWSTAKSEEHGGLTKWAVAGAGNFGNILKDAEDLTPEGLKYRELSPSEKRAHNDKLKKRYHEKTHPIYHHPGARRGRSQGDTHQEEA
ncbi:hypothetical protein TrCOL_g9450, partial [Triparma columacea]